VIPRGRRKPAVAPGAGAYLSEADFFDPNWKASYWGANFDRLAAIKKRYDPEGLFFTHHGVGSDEWSAVTVISLLRVLSVVVARIEIRSLGRTS
jgi:hypothetical protein